MEYQIDVLNLFATILSCVVGVILYYVSGSVRNAQRENERTEARVNELWREFNLCRRDCEDKRCDLKKEIAENCLLRHK